MAQGSSEVVETRVMHIRAAVAARINRLYAHARRGSTENLAAYAAVGMALLEEKSNHAKGWLKWIEKNLLFSADKAERMMRLAREFRVNAEYTDAELQDFVLQLWGNDKKIRGTQGTGENEWHTPEEYLELARKVLGEIDLDPASSCEAQITVRATRFFTKEDDGLKRDWSGRVWLNPPYAQPLIAHFVDKMLAERNARRISAAIMLTHNYSDTEWFQSAISFIDAVCFTSGRIRFVDPEGNRAAPTQGQTFFYFGPERVKFHSVFVDTGFVLVRP